MRTRIRMLAVPVLSGALALLGAGCTGDGGPPAGPEGDPPASSPGSSAPAGERRQSPIVFNEERPTGTHDCGGRDVTVNGQDADLHLTGRCGTVVVNGERASVTVDDAALIIVNGERVELTYSGDPDITVNGEDATATRA